MTQDVRWKQRFSNFLRAFQTLTEAIELSQTRTLTPLEQQGLIQGFEFTHELAWNVLKDYLTYQGISDLVGSRDASRSAFKNALVQDGDVWMKMIEARNQTSHTYNIEIAQTIVKSICQSFYPAFQTFAEQFKIRAK
jgi:nucleotidyltransferase substrate binding protein (TIGR01987 family)